MKIGHSREQTCLGLPFQVSTNMSTLYRRFHGECIATFFLHIDPKTANMSQFLQLLRVTGHGKRPPNVSVLFRGCGFEICEWLLADLSPKNS